MRCHRRHRTPIKGASPSPEEASRVRQGKQGSKTVSDKPRTTREVGGDADSGAQDWDLTSALAFAR